MTNSSKFLLILLILILGPVLNIKGHYINPSEFYLYIVFFLNLKNLKPDPVATTFMRYGLFFTMTIILTSVLAGNFINNHDIFILRNCLQLIFSIFLFKYYLDNIPDKEDLIFKSFILLSIPALFVFLQRLDLFNFRDFIGYFYQAKFHELKADVFSDYRYASVFKDFFTSAVYFIILSIAMTAFIVQSNLNRKKKNIMGFLLLLVYLAQFYVARSSLLLIPFCSGISFLLLKKRTVIETFKVILGGGLLLFPLYIFISQFYIQSAGLNREWVGEVFDITRSDTESKVSSYEVMNQWNQNFLNYVIHHPELLIKPQHAYTLTEKSDPMLYTDSFYPQEIYRYGVYGLLAYLYLVIVLIWKTKNANKALALIVVVFLVLNYKGGNVIFMARNIYLYGFIFAVLPIFNKSATTV